MRWGIHHGGEPSAVEVRGPATSLHSFDGRDILDEYLFPHGRVLGPMLRELGASRCLFAGVVKGYGLDRAIMGNGVQANMKDVIIVHADQDIGIKRHVFRGRVPF